MADVLYTVPSGYAQRIILGRAVVPRPASTYCDCFGFASGIARRDRAAYSCAYCGLFVLLVAVVTIGVMVGFAYSDVDKLERQAGLVV